MGGMVVLWGFFFSSILFAVAQVPPCDIQVLQSGKHNFEFIWSYGHQILQAQGVQQSDVDDILQETVVRLLQTKAQFEGRSSYKSWVHRVVMNQFYDHVRRRARALSDEYSRELIAKALQGATPADVTVANQEEAVRAALDFRTAIRQLRFELRAVFLMDAEGIKTPEISKRLGGVPPSTVKTRLFRARVAIDQNMDREGEAVAVRGSREEGWKPMQLPQDHAPSTIEEAMGHLTELQRQLLTWHVIFEMPLNHVAAMVGRSIAEANREILLGQRTLLGICEAHGISIADEKLFLPIPTTVNLKNLHHHPRTQKIFVKNLEEAISKLSDRCRLIVELRVLHGISDKVQISQMTRIPISLVRSRYNWALERLTKILTDNQISDPRSAFLTD